MPIPVSTNATMPVDRNGQNIPIFRGSTVRTNLTAGGTSTNAALPSGYNIILIRATDNIWYNLGTSGVTASAASTSVLFPAGEAAIVVPSGVTHIAVLQVGAAAVPVQVEGAEG